MLTAEVAVELRQTEVVDEVRLEVVVLWLAVVDSDV
jgi:hypothetical protein